MRLSSCGIDCDACLIGAEKGCQGCYAVQGKPFWAAEPCDLYACAAEKSRPPCSQGEPHGGGGTHCGQCGEFPCSMLKEWAAGENGERIENLRKREAI